MKIEHFKTRKEAEERANALLFQDRKNPLTMVTKSYTLNMPNGNIILNQIDEESKAQALIRYSEFTREDGYTHTSAELLYIAPTDELTYPFRGVSREYLSYAYFVSALASPFVKPSIPLTAEEAQTYKGETIIRDYFAYSEEWREMEENLRRVMESGEPIPEQDEADKDEDEAVENPLLWRCIPPSMFAELTGKKIKTAAEYVSAIAVLSGRELSTSEKRVALWNYHFTTRELFYLYATYSFLLTEQYSDLKKALSSYRKFGLTKEWEKEYAELTTYEESAERRIISRYYDSETYKLLSPISLRELSQYTGIPLTTLYDYAGGSPIRNRARRTIKRKR